jgi:LacI family transcriptional regulator
MACAEAGRAVPDQVAVLGVDNDEVICELSSPSLSSIEPDTHRLGYAAAALLDRLMAGARPPKQPVLIAPKGIQVRQSSDVLAMEDPDVAAAVRIIRDGACTGISVGDVVRQLAISRPTLDRRFVRLLGHSPKAEIERVRFERATSLLAETPYKMERIAGLLGFGTAPQFAIAFKRYTGLTPSQYRNHRK